MQQWCTWLLDKNRNDEKTRRVGRMLTGAEGGGVLHAITESGSVEEEVQVPGGSGIGCKAREDKGWAKHWQCDSGAQGVEDRPWGNEELRILKKGCNS